MKKLRYLVLLAALAGGCARENVQRHEAIGIPADISTQSQRNYIAQIKNEIQELGNEEGLGRDFVAFPVVVVENSPVADSAAYCQQDSKGRGVYIGVLRKTIEIYATELRDTDSLFMLLLHEYGHCFYGRAHDEGTVSAPGYRIMFARDSVGGYIPYPYNDMRVSAMTNQRLLVGYVLPRQLKRYFLLEIAGKARWRNIDDLAATPGLSLQRLPTR